MENDDWGAAEPIRQSIHDLVHTIGTHLGLIPADQPTMSPAHDKAIADMNAKANSERTANATKSFITPDAATNIRKKMSK